MPKKVILLTLQTFSATGGIQKMARTLAHSLHHICQKNNWALKLLSLYDSDDDLLPQYLPAQNFKGFNKNKSSFIWRTLFYTKNNDTLILSHINFAVVGILAKLLNPKCNVWLIAHGIEVWRPLSFQKRLLLKYCDKIICVSQFTKHKLVTLHNANADKCVILNNAIDPFIKRPGIFTKPDNLLKRYGITTANPVIFTLTRLASTEKYKGYENVITAVGALKHQFPGIKYILSGKYDEREGVRVKELIRKHDVSDNVILTGFIDEAELVDHFLLADLFVLPSKKEGFGIVFIEALACGLPVLCGNADGSVDAIRNGELGTAIDPDDNEELGRRISEYLTNPLTVTQRSYLQKNCLQYFSEESYINNLRYLLDS
ncbi:glycosyltransferase family 4 protein [Mucilaginibacter gilvus]|uniref:Glycosyltransferase family 1 protein n=1 Tax=Mucilaginibacter gilvus TaxID=2305909 RepID=A0A3S3VW02_9SPHI|nr:glycosyltransferase family 4 protein [Mucilaginibacter gilvus]RWY57314.1 glycosyltransferase family 1 protein [Mucilaginibacter gilvus]